MSTTKPTIRVTGQRARTIWANVKDRVGLLEEAVAGLEADAGEKPVAVGKFVEFLMTAVMGPDVVREHAEPSGKPYWAMIADRCRYNPDRCSLLDRPHNRLTLSLKVGKATHLLDFGFWEGFVLLSPLTPSGYAAIKERRTRIAKLEERHVVASPYQKHSIRYVVIHSLCYVGQLCPSDHPFSPGRNPRPILHLLRRLQRFLPHLSEDESGGLRCIGPGGEPLGPPSILCPLEDYPSVRQEFLAKLLESNGFKELKGFYGSAAERPRNASLWELDFASWDGEIRKDRLRLERVRHALSKIQHHAFPGHALLDRVELLSDSKLSLAIIATRALRRAASAWLPPTDDGPCEPELHPKTHMDREVLRVLTRVVLGSVALGVAICRAGGKRLKSPTKSYASGLQGYTSGNHEHVEFQEIFIEEYLCDGKRSRRPLSNKSAKVAKKLWLSSRRLSEYLYMSFTHAKLNRSVSALASLRYLTELCQDLTAADGSDEAAVDQFLLDLERDIGAVECLREAGDAAALAEYIDAPLTARPRAGVRDG